MAGTVNVKFAEGIEVRKTRVDHHHAAHRKARQRPIFPARLGAIVAVDVGNDVLQVLLRALVIGADGRRIERRASSRVRHNNDHRLRLAAGDQVIENVAGITAIEVFAAPFGVVVPAAVVQVEHRVSGAGIAGVIRRQVHMHAFVLVGVVFIVGLLDLPVRDVGSCEEGPVGIGGQRGKDRKRADARFWRWRHGASSGRRSRAGLARGRLSREQSGKKKGRAGHEHPRHNPKNDSHCYDSSRKVQHRSNSVNSHKKSQLRPARPHTSDTSDIPDTSTSAILHPIHDKAQALVSV